MSSYVFKQFNTQALEMMYSQRPLVKAKLRYLAEKLRTYGISWCLRGSVKTSCLYKVITHIYSRGKMWYLISVF